MNLSKVSYFFFGIREINFQSNLVLVVVLVLTSKSLLWILLNEYNKFGKKITIHIM